MPIPLSLEEIVICACGYPSKCRGDCGGVWLSVLSLLYEVIVVWLSAQSLLCEVTVVWLSALSLLCEVIVIVPCLLCRGGCVRERSCVLLSLYYQILDGGSLCGRSYVDIVEILLCEGRDEEQWLEPQNISWCLRLIYFL